jgi:adenylate cyclase
MLDYRSLGDAINTAARLETINGHFNTHVCVSGATVEQCPDFIGRPVGQLVLKGKSRVTMAYEPLTAVEATEPRITEYQAAYRLLDADDATAGAVFHELLKKYPDDPLIAYHAQRLAHGETGSRIVLKNK